MENIAWFVFGVFVGWITKIPWLIKWYREFQEEEKINERFREYLKNK